MASVTKWTYITPEEHLALERAADEKSEYRDGEIFLMPGVKRPHSLIASNLARHIGNQIAGRDCELYIAEMKLGVARTKSYCYPDLAVLRGEAQMADQFDDIVLNPTVVIEILSPSTERRDRGVKFADYRELESLRDYVLVAQYRISIEHHARRGDAWDLTTLDHAEATLSLPSIGCEPTLRDIYARVPTA